MTNASLTAIQAMVSTPLALIASAFCTKPGKCRALQVGVNAPGTANNTTFFPLKISSVATSFGPSAVAIISFIDGIVSPTLIVIVLLLPKGTGPRVGPPGDHGRLLARPRTRVTTPTLLPELVPGLVPRLVPLAFRPSGWHLPFA